MADFATFMSDRIDTSAAYFSVCGSPDNFPCRYIAILDVSPVVPYSAVSTPLAGGRPTHLRRPKGPLPGKRPSKIVSHKIDFFARLTTRGTFLDHIFFGLCVGGLTTFMSDVLRRIFPFTVHKTTSLVDI